jgi:sugar lactone lactonase YvrE
VPRGQPRQRQQPRQRYSPSPPPQVYVIDLETKKTQAFPSSFTPYGLTFSRDGKSLLVGSFETGELIRINLQAGWSRWTASEVSEGARGATRASSST